MSKEIPLKPILIRGWKKKCPSCGEGDLIHKWIQIKDHCNSCELKYEADRGDSYGFFVILDRVFVLVALALLFFGVVPENTNEQLAMFSVILIPFIITMPNRTGVCLALDYWVRLKTSN